MFEMLCYVIEYIIGGMNENSIRQLVMNCGRKPQRNTKIFK